jgi:hypothetical protein
MSTEAVVRTTKDWNRFILALVNARDEWDKMQRALDDDPVHGDDLPPAVQKLLSMHRRMQFSVAIKDLSDHWTSYGGLESFYVTLPEDEALRERYDALMGALRKGNGNGRRG